MEVNLWGAAVIYDKQFQIDHQCVPSGVPMPITRKGDYTIGPFPSGETPLVGRYVAVKGTGDIGVVLSATGLVGTISGFDIGKPLPVFGKCLGPKDANGYALIQVDCYRY